MPDNKLLLEINDLHTYFHTDEGLIKAVQGASLKAYQGRTLCIVGESGCGKSITARSILQIVDSPGRVVSGDILFHHPDRGTVNLAKMNPRGKDIRHYRGKEIGYVFQEPLASFSPVHTIGDQIAEMVLLHEDVSKQEAATRVVEVLRQVGIPNAEKRLDVYPFQLSGGMRQRAMIALALACNPRLLIVDEPTTALDVTTQAQILELIQSLKETYKMGVILITHDLGVVAEMADDVAVMYLGRAVETADVDSIFYNPQHPYTKGLLESIPRLGSKGTRLASIKGMVPHPLNRPKGCPFHPRCPVFMEGICDGSEPQPVRLAENHEVRCFKSDGKVESAHVG